MFYQCHSYFHKYKSGRLWGVKWTFMGKLIFTPQGWTNYIDSSTDGCLF